MSSLKSSRRQVHSTFHTAAASRRPELVGETVVGETVVGENAVGWIKDSHPRWPQGSIQGSGERRAVGFQSSFTLTESSGSGPSPPSVKSDPYRRGKGTSFKSPAPVPLPQRESWEIFSDLQCPLVADTCHARHQKMVSLIFIV